MPDKELVLSDHETRIREVEKVIPALIVSVEAIRKNTDVMAGAVTGIARVEQANTENHAAIGRAFAEIKEIKKQCLEIERKKGKWDLVSTIVFGGCALILTSVIGAVIVLVVK